MYFLKSFHEEISFEVNSKYLGSYFSSSVSYSIEMSLSVHGPLCLQYLGGHTKQGVRMKKCANDVC